VASRTQVVCLHEGKAGRSIDPIFIRTLIKAIDPAWIRPWKGNNIIRSVDCGTRSQLIARMPDELRACLNAGGDTTLMVWADLDDDMEDGVQLRREFWNVALLAGITREQFDQIVFAFAMGRLENWIEFLTLGNTDESAEGPRIKHGRQVADAAKVLADRCTRQLVNPPLPPSLAWSCKNWRELVRRMS